MRLNLHVKEFALFLIAWTCLIVLPSLGFSQDSLNSRILYSKFPQGKPYHSAVFPGLEYTQPERPKIGLALSGGGLKGIAHAGVLKALVESGIPIDYITGTSAGSIVGGLYAVGYDVNEVDSISRYTDYTRIFLDRTQRRNLFVNQKEQASKYILDVRFDSLRPHIPLAISSGQNVNQRLTDMYLEAPYNTVNDFDNLRVPFRVVATELGSGDRIVIQHGDWVNAIRASMSIPMVLSPVRRDHQLLIDGGIADNIPINLARQLGADMVIAVDVRAKLYKQKELKSLLTVADQIINILINSSRDQVLNNADIVITPSIADEDVDPENQPSLWIKSGYETTKSLIPKIRKVYSKLNNRDTASYTIDKIRVRSQDSFTADQILDLLGEFNLNGPVRFSAQKLDSISQRLLTSGYFKAAGVVLMDSSDVHTLNILTESNPVVKHTRISGVNSLPDSLFHANLNATVGIPYNGRMLEAILTRLVKFYRTRGYPLAKVDTVIWHPEQNSLKVGFSEGEIGKISVAGNEHTRRYIITREMGIKPGDILRKTKLDNALTHIYSTELFEIVGAAFQPLPVSDKWELIVQVREKNYLGAKFGYRLTNQRGDVGIFGISNQNFLGNGIRLESELKLGTQQGYLHANVGSYRFLNTYLTYNIGLGINWDWYDIYINGENLGRTYRQTRNFFRYSMGHQIARLGLVNFTGQLQKLDFKGPVTQSGIYNDDYTMTTFSLESVIDTKDRAIFPQNGNYQRIFYQFGTTSLGGDVGFTKFSIESDWYFTILRRNTLHPMIKIGLADETLPFSEWFQLGGIDSFFGLHEYELLGKRLYQGGLEYRYRLPVSSLFDLHLFLRYDIATITVEKIEHLGLKDFFTGKGGGVGVVTPLGPARIAFGESDRDGLLTYFYFGWDF